MATNDTSELFFGEYEMGSEEESWLLRELDMHNDSSLNLAYVQQKFETPTSKLRTPELHFSYEDEASGYGFSARKQIIFDDSTPLKDTNTGDSDDVAVDLGDGFVVDQSSKEVDLPSSSTGNPKKKGSLKK